MRADGLFGPIEVVDNGVIRETLLNGEHQGGVYHLPSARVVDPELSPGPGPVPNASYAAGWLAAGVHHPAGVGVMVGLGSGAGAVQLLANFPQIHLTVIEIDRAMVDLTRAAYPLVEYYEDLGRLHIVVSDAQEWLDSHPGGWDFSLADAYTGEHELVGSYLETLVEQSDACWLNVIDELLGRSMTRIDVLLDALDRPVTQVFKSVPAYLVNRLPFGAQSNWIVTNDRLDWPALERFVPFAGLEGESVEYARRNYRSLLDSATIPSAT